MTDTRWIKLGDAVKLLMERKGWPPVKAERAVEKAIIDGKLPALAASHGLTETVLDPNPEQKPNE